MSRSVRSFELALLAVIFACYAPSISGAETPRLVKKDGRYALMVDGQPFLVLGAQINNSSAWPAVLPQVWQAGTVVIPAAELMKLCFHNGLSVLPSASKAYTLSCSVAT